MLNNFEKFSFPSIEKIWTKDKETDGKKKKRKKKKRKKRKKEKKKTDILKEKKQTEKLRAESWEIIEGLSLPPYIQS